MRIIIGLNDVKYCQQALRDSVNLCDLPQLLQLLPGFRSSPSIQTILQIKPVSVRHIKALRQRPTVAVLRDPVAAHGLAWLGVEVRRIAEGMNGGLGSGDLLDG